ncbi:MAG: hypothetical protein P8107_07280 [Spirochaetia bacterium]
MAELNFSSCRECRFFMKISHTYCYHPTLYGAKLDNPSVIPEWCPLLHE